MSRPRIAHITLLPHENDARVLRAVEGLHSSGFDCPIVAPGYGFDLPEATALQKAQMALAFATGGRLGPAVAERAFFALPHLRNARDALIKARPHAIHAHDWDGLIVGAAAARKLAVPFAYDAHELASHMHTERHLWRASVGRLIQALEPPKAALADFVVAVSDGHASALERELSLSERPVVVRNITRSPAIDRVENRNASSDILIHYHGALGQGRGIEVTVEALKLLPDHFSLRLTGGWTQPAFETLMRERIAAMNLGSRIEIVPPLPHGQLVDHASEADIGLCILEPENLHNRIALPNKVFDYLKAGLPIITYGTGELDWVEEAGAGFQLSASSAPALAKTLISLDRPAIDAMREKALRLAALHDFERDLDTLATQWRAVLSAAN